MSLVPEELKAKAEVYYGDEICQVKSRRLLREVGLPDGLLQLRDMVECGFVEETGFVWMKQKRAVEHCFEKIGRKVSYGPEVTAQVGKSKINQLTGVKAKELLVWITLAEVSAAAADPTMINFKSPSGLVRTFPASAFELEVEEGDTKEEGN